VGLNVFVSQAVAKDVPVHTVFRGIVPFSTLVGHAERSKVLSMAVVMAGVGRRRTDAVPFHGCLVVRAEIDKQTKPHSCGLQTIQDLRSMFVANIRERFNLHDNGSITNQVKVYKSV
jgi:hypothetical protein